MNREDWVRVEGLFQAALDREPGERDIFLHDACQGLPELRREVDSLLDSFAGAADVVGSAVSRAAQSLERATPFAGRGIGIYEVIRELGMDTDFLLSRFRR